MSHAGARLDPGRKGETLPGAPGKGSQSREGRVSQLKGRSPQRP
jgi:hypothetical protein